MGYYRGDGANYYRGDYYRGDPFIGGLVAGAVGKLAGKAAGWVGRQVGRAGRSAGPILRDIGPSTIAGGIGVGIGRIPQIGPMLGGGTGKKPKKEPRYRKDGTLIRTMNPLNPRALRRALRRAEGFEKFAARTVNAMYRVIDGKKVRTYKKRKSS